MDKPFVIIEGGLAQDYSKDVIVIDLDEYEIYGDVDFERFEEHWNQALETGAKWVIERLDHWVQNHPNQEEARSWCEENNVPWKGES